MRRLLWLLHLVITATTLSTTGCVGDEELPIPLVHDDIPDAGDDATSDTGLSHAHADASRGPEDAGDVDGPCATACTGETPICHEAAGLCVGCVTSSDCGGDTPVCYGNACVGCSSNTHCLEPEASTCDPTTRTCVGCADSAGCAHVEDKPACDVDAATCVPCTVDHELACGGRACHPATNSCTATPIGSVQPCEPCVADSQCAGDGNYRCVPLRFQGAEMGGFCLRRASAEGGCLEPFRVVVRRESLSGAPVEDYCGINEALTTCEALLDFAAHCTSASDCGAPDLDDARCETVNGAISRCTYPCSENFECGINVSCGPETTPDKYCGAT